MVEYLSGGRVQGSSALEASADFTDNFTSDTPWTFSRAGTEIQITGGKMVFTDFQNGGQWRSAYRSTGLDVNDTKWVLRFKFRFSAASSQSFWILGLSSGTSNPTGSSEYIVGAYFVDTPYMEIAKKSSSDSYRSWTGGNVFNPSADTDYYIQIIRTGETEVQMKMFTNSNFLDGLVGTNTQTIDSNYAGLDYLMISNQSNGSNTRTMTGEIDDIQIWNGVTTTTEDEKDSLTNVPANTRYEEYNTRKIFRAIAGGSNEIVAWSTTNGSSYSSPVLTKTASDSWTNAINTTSTTIPNTGVREIKCTGTSGNNVRMGVLPSANTLSDKDAFSHSWHLGGYAEVYEGSTQKYENQSPNYSDTFTINIDASGNVLYKINGTTVYTSSSSVTSKLKGGSVAYAQGSTTDLRFTYPLFWKERNTA